ncbi:hypothetical protein ACOJQI_10955 [Bacillus salacetis]|uniref:hypothetical protein n=1 Tax=Bacillus salacetis TaxID=2315464 RepID=UPI003BA22B22
MKLVKLILALIILSLTTPGCGVADGGKVTARNILKQNEDADIIQYDGFIYNNVTDLDWFKDDNNIPFSKELLLGEIENQTTNRWFFGDFSATKLPEGTKIYSNEEEGKGILFVEFNGEELYYMQLLEG